MLRDLVVAALVAILLFLALVGVASAAPAKRDPLVAHIARHTKNHATAVLIVARARAEGKRRGLDPIALLAVAWVESGYQSWRTLKGDGSHGIYQIIGGHPGPREARALLSGCTKPGEPCEAPEVAKRRRKTGPWSKRELRDVVISTYLAAYEIQRHIAVCHRRRHKPHRHPHCRGIQWLTRWGHFNAGYNNPRWYYLSRLCKRYRILKAL